MLKDITPFIALVANGDKRTINAVRLTNFSGYDFSGYNGGNVEYALGYKELIEDEEVFTPLQNCSITIPANIVANWGSDDNVIVNYIMQEKNY